MWPEKGSKAEAWRGRRDHLVAPRRGQEPTERFWGRPLERSTCGLPGRAGGGQARNERTRCLGRFFQPTVLKPKRERRHREEHRRTERAFRCSRVGFSTVALRKSLFRQRNTAGRLSSSERGAPILLPGAVPRRPPRLPKKTGRSLGGRGVAHLGAASAKKITSGHFWGLFSACKHVPVSAAAALRSKRGPILV